MEAAQGLPGLGQGSLRDLDDEPRLDPGAGAEMGGQLTSGQKPAIEQGNTAQRPQQSGYQSNTNAPDASSDAVAERMRELRGEN